MRVTVLGVFLMAFASPALAEPPYLTTPKEEQGESETGFNIGLVADVTESHHVLFSAGRGLQGPNDFHAYLAYQFTFGLEH